MKQMILDLTDPSDISEVDHNVDLFHGICNSLKLPSSMITLIDESEGKFHTDLMKSVFEGFSDKFNTKLLYVEKEGDSTTPVQYSNIHPYYSLHPMNVEEWTSFVREYVEVNCSGLLKHLEDYNGVTPNNIKYGMSLYDFVDLPGCGLVFSHYNNEGSTSVRLYIKVGNIVYYMPSKVFNRSSGRYNKVTNHNYPDSIKMLILSLQTIDMDDLRGTVELLKSGINTRRTKVLSIEEILTLLSTCKEEAPEELSKYCSDMYVEDPDSMSDQLWRLTNLNKTLGSVLDSFKSPVKSPDARRYLGQLVYDTLVCDRLYKEG